MAEYTKLNCPVCGEEFKENDDIVVCPICGTPHHRECFKKEGKCANEHWHTEGKVFDAESERAEKATVFADDVTQEKPLKTCPRCGNDNPADAVFCSKCGIPLSQGIPGEEGGARGFTFAIGYNPFIPKPDEKIDGVEAWKLSAVVKENVPKFLMQFKSMYKSGKKISFNFCAMFFGWIYFLYRKMYSAAIAILAVNVVFAFLPYLLLAINGQADELLQLQKSMTEEALAAFLNSTAWAFNIGRIASWAFSLACSLFANWMYFKKCKKIIAKIEEQTTDKEEFKEKANKKGGVNRVLIISLLVFYAAAVWLAMGFMSLT